MNDTTWHRLFGFRHAFDHPVTVVVTLTAVVLTILSAQHQGWAISRSPQRRTGNSHSLSSSQAGLPASRVFRVPLQLLRQIGRNVRDDQSIVALVSQFEDVTNPMDLRDQRAFVRGNPKPRAQSP
jgi:hypothetical protein